MFASIGGGAQVQETTANGETTFLLDETKTDRADSVTVVATANPGDNDWSPNVPTVFLHSCTMCDCACGIIFLACVAVAGLIGIYAEKNGDMRKVFHGMDFMGNICGEGVKVDQPFVYWCAVSGGGLGWQPVTELDLHHPICVDHCPTTGAGEHACYDSRTGTSHVVPDYPTFSFAGLKCIPQDENVRHRVMDKYGEHWVEKYTELIIGSFVKGWPVLSGIFGLSFIISYMYVIILECHPGGVIVSSVMFVCCISLGLGSFIVYKAVKDNGVDGMPGSGDGQTDIITGVLCGLVFVYTFCLLCCRRREIDRTNAAVLATLDFLKQCWGMFGEPALCVFYRSVVWVVGIYGLVWLISVGKVDTTRIYRHFDYNTEQQIMIIFYIFMVLWADNLVTACTQYVVAHSAARWYFSESELRDGYRHKNVEWCLLQKGYCGMVMQFGSLCQGSFAITLARPFQVVSGIVSFFTGRCTNSVLCFCCSPLCSCLDALLGSSTYMRYNKMAYIQMSITSDDFFTAADNAEKKLKEGSAVVRAIPNMKSACELFVFCGILNIAAIGAFFTYFVVSFFWPWNDPLSKRFVQDEMVMVAVGAAVAVLVALNFMCLFDTIWDTLVLCHCYDCIDKVNNPPPEKKKLKSYVEEEQAQGNFLTTLASMVTGVQPPSEVSTQVRTIEGNPGRTRPVYHYRAFDDCLQDRDALWGP